MLPGRGAPERRPPLARPPGPGRPLEGRGPGLGPERPVDDGRGPGTGRGPGLTDDGVGLPAPSDVGLLPSDFVFSPREALPVCDALPGFGVGLGPGFALGLGSAAGLSCDVVGLAFMRPGRGVADVRAADDDAVEGAVRAPGRTLRGVGCGTGLAAPDLPAPCFPVAGFALPLSERGRLGLASFLTDAPGLGAGLPGLGVFAAGASEFLVT